VSGLRVDVERIDRKVEQTAKEERLEREKLGRRFDERCQGLDDKLSDRLAAESVELTKIREKIAVLVSKIP